jgi:hypothetical protein
LPTLLFVHGTGVRGESYFRTVNLIGQKVGQYLEEFTFKSCRWGDPQGARLHYGGASIPDYDESGDTRGRLEDANMARWHLLSQDPLLELRILPRTSVIGQAPGIRIWKFFEALPSHENILGTLTPWCADTAWAPFLSGVLQDPTWKKTVEAITDVPAAVSDRVARAVTAAFQIYLRHAGLPGLTAQERDQLKTALIGPVGGPAAGVIGDWFLDRLSGVAKARRGSITDISSPCATRRAARRSAISFA